MFSYICGAIWLIFTNRFGFNYLSIELLTDDYDAFKFIYYGILEELSNFLLLSSSLFLPSKLTSPRLPILIVALSTIYFFL